MQTAFVKDHALLYIGRSNGSRTSLSVEEIMSLICNQAFVRLGSNNTDFDLVWDHHENKAVILLTRDGRLKNERAIISVWGIDFEGLPREVTQEDIEKAKALSCRPGR